MFDLISDPIPWFLAGPLMGLCVAGLYAVSNRHLGVSGAYMQVIDFARGRQVERWRLWFLAGTFAGGAVIALLGGNEQTGLEYGSLGEELSLPLLAAVLFAGAVLIGYGSRWAGDCTSGHGLTGCAIRSRGSLIAIATFMATAVGFTLLIHALTGGRI
jgi:uncharacterized membrane protein YedE/YeeE